MDLRECPACRLAWWDWPAFSPEALYDETYFQSASTAKGYDDYAGLERGLRRTSRGRLARIERLLPAGGGRALLDVGCATGVFLDEARKRGWSPVRGVEVSVHAAAVAADRGLEVWRGTLDAYDPAARFDALTLWDVIEHVTDPPALVRECHARLRPGGVLALSTGDVTSWCARLSGPRWHLYNLPEHLFFFSPAALERILAASGFELLWLRGEVTWVPVSYLAERLVKSLGRTRGRERPGTAGWIVPATLGDVLGVYARRL